MAFGQNTSRSSGRQPTIVIDAGHGGDQDVGKSTAFGARGPRGTLEKHVTLDLARQIADHLGPEAVLTRREDQNLSLAARAATAKRLGAPVFLSLHANDGAAGARGTEVYTHPSGGAASQALAASLRAELARLGGARGQVHSAEMAVLHPEHLPRGAAACLVEVDYLSSADGERRLRDPKALGQLARSIASGVRGYLGGGATRTYGSNDRYGRRAASISVGLALQSSRFQGDPLLEQISNGTTTLRQGAKGDPVRKIQQALSDLGFTTGVDGDFGPATLKQVKAFQSSEGLGADGIIGKNTLNALDAHFSGAGPTPVATTARVRREINALSLTEIAALAKAIDKLKKSGRYDFFVRDHANSMMNAHRQAAFTVWHRSFLINYESELQAIDSSVTLPYWDWSAEPNGATTWNAKMVALLGGDGDPSDSDFVKTGPFAGWVTANSSGNPTKLPLQRTFGKVTSDLPRGTDVKAAIGVTPYDASPWNDGFKTTGFRNTLEGWNDANGFLHNSVHVWVGGSMLPGTSPNDPVFFLHHCHIDKIFSDWQAANSSVSYVTASSGVIKSALGDITPVGFNDQMGSTWSDTGFTASPKEMWDNTNLKDHLGNTGLSVSYR